MTSFDFSEFDQIAAEISEMRKSSEQIAKVNPAFLKLEEMTQNAFNVSGLIYAETTSKLTHPDKKSSAPVDFPIRANPRSASDDFSAGKIKANFYFRCCIISLAAQNKGRIALVDLCALHVSFNLGYFHDTTNKSTSQIAKKLTFDLCRDVIVKGEYLEIPGIKMTEEAGKYTKIANVKITLGRAKFAAESTVEAAKK
jgi:hypothetical protein